MKEHTVDSITQLSDNLTIEQMICSSFGYQQKKLFMRVNLVTKDIEFCIEVNRKVVNIVSDIFEAIKSYNTAIHTYSDLEEE